MHVECGFRINANLVKEDNFRINAKLVKEKLKGFGWNNVDPSCYLGSGFSGDISIAINACRMWIPHKCEFGKGR